MTGEPTPFMDYWDAVDEAMVKLFGVDTADAAIEPELIAAAQEEGWAPEQFALWCAKLFEDSVAKVASI